MAKKAANHPWLKSYPDGLDWHGEIAPKPVFSLLDRAVADFPNNPAMDFMGKITSYAELGDMVNRAAKGFRELGVKKGVHVGLFLPNCPQSLICYYAIMKAGGTVVNFSPLYSLPELEHQVKDSDTQILVTLNLEALYPKAAALVGHGKLKKLVVGKLTDVLPFPKNMLFRLFKGKEISKMVMDTQHVSFDALLAHPPIKRAATIDPENHIAVLQYTGGTTGVPKGAVLTHKNVYVNAVQSGRWMDLDARGEGRTLAVLPFFHVFAMTTVLNFGMYKGNCLIMLPRFELNQVVKLIHKKKPTLMPGVPTMFNAIINHPKLSKYDLSSLKCCISGGAPLPADVKHRFEALTHCKLIEGYGLTETSPVVSCNPVHGVNKTGSIGLPFIGTEVLIEDVEKPGRFLPQGHKGELCVKGPQVMDRYWQNEEETKAVLRDGILRTGDIATLDEDGYIFITDRLKDMIIAGGFKIYPRDVEEAIFAHEAVEEAAVVGVDDSYRGQTVKAFVKLHATQLVSEESLRNFLKERLGKHEVPTEIVFINDIPKTMVGKVDKKALRG